MKSFNELTDDEVLALGDAEVETYIDLACAEEGVPFLPPLPEAPEKYDPKGTVTIFRVGGEEFTDSAEAEAIASAINAATSRVNVSAKYPQGGWRGQSQWVLDGEDEAREVSVSTQTVFTLAEYEQHRARLAAYLTDKNEYDEKLATYKSVASKREDARIPITERVDHVKSAAALRGYLIAGFAPYVELADGDKTVAMRFYRRAVLLPTDVVEELVPGFFETPAAADERAVVPEVEDEEEVA